MPTDTPANDHRNNPVAVTGAQNYAKKLLATGMAYEFQPDTIATGAYLEGYASGAVDLARVGAERDHLASLVKDGDTNFSSLADENEELRQSHAAIYAALGTQEADHTKWPEQVAALRRDKERLDWLEKRGMCFNGADKLAEQTDDGKWEAWIVGNETEWAYSDARAAIDAAMKGDRDE